MSVEEAIQFAKDGLEDDLEKLLSKNPQIINAVNAVSDALVPTYNFLS